MLVDGLVLGTMVTIGFCITFGRLPPWLKTFAMNHPVASEILISCGVYAILGMTLTAHVAVAVTVLEVQGLLHIARNPEKFLFLKAARDRARDALRGITDKVDQINENYKASLPEVSK